MEIKNGDSQQKSTLRKDLHIVQIEFAPSVRLREDLLKFLRPDERTVSPLYSSNFAAVDILDYGTPDYYNQIFEIEHNLERRGSSAIKLSGKIGFKEISQQVLRIALEPLNQKDFNDRVQSLDELDEYGGMRELQGEHNKRNDYVWLDFSRRALETDRRLFRKARKNLHDHIVNPKLSALYSVIPLNKLTGHDLYQQPVKSDTTTYYS